ncbi:MAG: Lrp/AsnC family transcriptional regulator [Promethearchaeota archaeon]
MTLCFIFLKTKAGFLESIIDNLNQIPEVLEAHAVTGGIDIIAKVESKNITTISKIVLAKIHRIDGVDRTSTHIVTPL